MLLLYVGLLPCFIMMHCYINAVWTANVTPLEYTRSYKEVAVFAKLSTEVARKHMDQVFVIPPYTFLLHSYENSITNNIFSERLKGPTQGWRGG